MPTERFEIDPEPQSCLLPNPTQPMSELSIAELTAKVTALEASVTTNTETLSTLPGSVDTFYYLFVGSLVFFMQAGFGLLEAGSVRTKNTKNILLKNLLDACMGAIVWWAWGYAAAVKLPLLRPARFQHARSLTHPHQPYRSPGPIRLSFAVRDGQDRQQVHRRHGQGQGLLRLRLR